MLNAMRKNAGSWMIKVLLGAIVVVFIFWGVGSFREQRGGRVALVNGQTITYDEYLKTYNAMIENLKLRFGDNLNSDLIKMLNVRAEALNEMINRKLLAEEAARSNFQVSKNELVSAIRSLEVFQRNGSFDTRLYRRVLEHHKRTPEKFEALQKETMLIDKLRTFIYNTVKVSDPETLEWYQWNRASVNIEFALFEPENYKNINPETEAVQAHFQNHEASYKTQPMIKVRYLRFEPHEYKSKVALIDQEAIDYFEENPQEFIVPKTVEARHILIKVQPDADAETVEQKRKKAEDIMIMAKEGKDFAQLAITYSEGPGKTGGGYLGAFSKEDMIKPFSDRAFSMAPGDISEPIRTQFGWHIIKVENVNEETRKTFSEAEPDIRKKLIATYAEHMAYNAAESVYDASFEEDDLRQIADSKNLTLLTTDFFTKTGPETNIAQSSQFASVAFNLESMEISEVQKLGSDYYILQAIEKMPEKIPEFADVEDKVRADLITKQQHEIANKDAEKLLSQLKSQTLTSEENNNVPRFISTGFFKRFDIIPEIGDEKNIAEVVFQLSKNNPFPENVINGNKGYYVIRFKERKTPGIEGFEGEKSEIKETLRRQKQAKTFNALVTQLRNNGDISIKDGFL